MVPECPITFGFAVKAGQKKMAKLGQLKPRHCSASQMAEHVRVKRERPDDATQDAKESIVAVWEMRFHRLAALLLDGFTGKMSFCLRTI